MKNLVLIIFCGLGLIAALPATAAEIVFTPNKHARTADHGIQLIEIAVLAESGIELTSYTGGKCLITNEFLKAANISGLDMLVALANDRSNSLSVRCDLKTWQMIARSVTVKN